MLYEENFNANGMVFQNQKPQSQPQVIVQPQQQQQQQQQQPQLFDSLIAKQLQAEQQEIVDFYYAKKLTDKGLVKFNFPQNEVAQQPEYVVEYVESSNDKLTKGALLTMLVGIGIAILIL